MAASFFPLPDTDWDATRAFWAGAERGELVIPRCGGCAGAVVDCWGKDGRLTALPPLAGARTGPRAPFYGKEKTPTEAGASGKVAVIGEHVAGVVCRAN